MAHDQEAHDYESAERDAEGKLVPGLPGGRGEEVVRQHNESILRQRETAETTVHNVTDETREALQKKPMGPEPKVSIDSLLEAFPDGPTGNMEYNDYMSAERDENGNLVRGYGPGR